MSFGSRTRLHHLARHTALLKRLALGITLFGFFGALFIIAVSPGSGASFYPAVDPEMVKNRNGWQDLQRADSPQPHELIQWLFRTIERLHSLSADLDGEKVTTWESYQQDGLIAGLEVRPLLEKHTSDLAVRQMWEEFIHMELSRDLTLRTALITEAEKRPPLITANWIVACQFRESAPAQSLFAMMEEAKFYPGSKLVKNSAFHLAVELKDKEVLQQIADQPEWWEAMPGELRHYAAAIIGDYRLQWFALMELLSVLSAPLSVIGVALLSASIWYVILILHGVRGRWRWVAPLLPLAAGILSGPPVLMIDAWQELTLGMAEDNPFPHDLWYQLGGVGMREEAIKLLLAALFMPWLLRKKPPGGALIVGAFVGLGFALEENINYYIMHQGGIPVTRFFTANFLHAAMTGITTHALYELLRTRFGSADRFIISFLGVVTVHGCYNYLLSLKYVEGTSLFGLILFTLTAWYFLDQVYLQCPRENHWITSAAVFLLGTATLMAIVFFSIAIRTPDRQLLVSAAIQCVECFPLAFVYWRRLSA